MAKKQILRIANAGGYWGDDPTALERQIAGGPLDYVTMDFLAEVTMSIMQKQRAVDPELGFAKDVLPMLANVLPQLMQKKVRLITNAGGVNPKSCAQAIGKLATSLGLKPKIAIVYGDDILHRIPELQKQSADFRNMETGEDFSQVASQIQAANVYFGAVPVVEALALGADIVITGRVTDTGITLAPMIHEFGWALDDWDKLASGIIAGHIIECGSQVTGGNFSDWHLVPSFNNIGYPIVEVSADGTFVVTKHTGTGGLVSVDTVREQLVYEMGNPRAYITPDVVADFSTVQLTQDGPDRVRASGIKGYEPTALYKVSMAHHEGFKCSGSIIISGPNAKAKAAKFADIFWQRFGNQFEETSTEYVGYNACHRSLGALEDTNEILLRLGARAHEKAQLTMFSKLIPSLILGGPPGVAVIGGAPKVQDVISYWPSLMPKKIIFPEIALLDIAKDNMDGGQRVNNTAIGKFKEMTSHSQKAAEADQTMAGHLSERNRPLNTPLAAICLARSGDKGDTANIGVLARSQKAYEFLDHFLTAQVVKNIFQELCHGEVVRYPIPNLRGFNFLLEKALGGGGTKTLRTDAQGKTFAQALLAQRIDIPTDVLLDARRALQSTNMGP